MKRFAIGLAVLLLVGCTPAQRVEETRPNVVVSEEAAVKQAKSADPRASVEGWAEWHVKLAENVQVEVEGKQERHTVWIIDATYHGGGSAVYYVDATVYPPRLLRMEGASYISREQAVEAALAGSTTLTAADAKFMATFAFDDPVQGHRELAVWMVELVDRRTGLLAAKAAVDAQTGKVLFLSSPPSGQ